MMSGILSHTPAYILRTRLINDGRGTSQAENRAWPIFVDGEPGEPDNVITIRDSTNRDVGYNQPRKEVQEQHGVQVRVRGKTIPILHAKFNELVVAIEKYINDTLIVESTTYKVTAYVASTAFPNRNTTLSRLPWWTINVMLDIHQQ